MPQFEREVEIHAPVEKAWNVLINSQYWPQWFPGVDGVSGVTSIGEGGSFEWTMGGKTGSGVVEKMEPQKRLVIRTQMGNDKDEHVFVLHPGGGLFGMNAGECKVEYTLDTLMGGGILANFIAGGNPKDELRVKDAMDHFKKLVEGH